MAWPLSQDYNEMIQLPKVNFADADLRTGEVATNALGLPMPCSGNFADVYQMRCPDGSRWAVKCFTREVPGLRERYQEISRHLRQAKLPFTVDFTYLEQGIRVAGKWFPVLKMQWVEGLMLNQFVAQNLDKPAMLEALLQIWVRMAKYLRAAEVGHCDLQHGNVLLVPGASANSLAIKLIDYDGMWVPGLAGTKSGEVGHASYQHPRRLREGTYNLDVDRFPLLLIATALRTLKTGGKALWEKYDDGDNMLFRQKDLDAPSKSAVFYELLQLGDPTDRQWIEKVIEAARQPLDQTPLLAEMLSEARPAPVRTLAPFPVAIPVAAIAATPTATKKNAFSDLGSPTTGQSKRSSQRTKAAKGGGAGKIWIGVAAMAAICFALCGGAAGAIYLATRGNANSVAQGTTPAQTRPNPPVTPTANMPVTPTKPSVPLTKPDLIVVPEIKSDPMDVRKKVGPVGGDGGGEFADEPLPKGARVVGVKIRWGRFIDAIQLLYQTADGKQESTDWHGGDGGVEETFKLEEGEFIKAIQVKTSFVKELMIDMVESLTIITNKGETKTYGGNAGEKTLELKVAEGDEVVGFFGRRGKWLDQIGIFVQKTTSPVPSPTPTVPARLTRTLDFDGFHVVGPFDNVKDDVGLDTVFPPELEKAPDIKSVYQGKSGKIGWSVVRPEATGYFNLKAFFEPNSDNIVSYLTREIDSPEDQDAKVLIGADDACKLWINGNLIHTNREHLSAVPAHAAVAVKLKKGKNRILFKINNGDHWHGFYMTILSALQLTALPVQGPPVPDAALLDFAEKKARRDHQAQYAKRKPEEIQAFANLLIKDGLDFANQPADRFVYLREARDLAALLNDLPLSMRAAEEMAKNFDVNAREMKAVALERAGGAATGLVGHSNVITFALAVAEEAEEDDDYEMAERLVKIAQTSATKAAVPALTGPTQGRIKEVASLRKAYEPVVDALRTLAAKADDADANLVVGRFYALAKGDWDRGLVALKRGSDAKLKALAESDLTVPSDAEASEELGDRYVAQAKAESEPAKTQLLYRACYWYAQADAQYRGQERTNKIRKKRLDIENTLPPSRVVVLFAWFGAYEGWTDVARNARCLAVQPGGLKSVAKAESVALGVDPAFGEEKTLAVVYRYRGAVHLSITPRGAAPIIPLPVVSAESAPGRPAPGQKLAILYARYGNEGTYADIAAKLQGAVKGNSLHFAAPGELGIPDPFGGRHKAVLIVYRLDGKVRLSISTDAMPTHVGGIGDSP